MAGADNIVINVRERPLSTDINDLQALAARTQMDAAAWLHSLRLYTAGSSPTSFIRKIVGGLDPVAGVSTANVNIQPGALLQDSVSLAPTPGSLDSSYRIGILRTQQAIAMASPGSDTWYVIEAQMVESTTSTQLRDILNIVTGVFTPTSVPKRRERSIQFQTLAGSAGQAPAISGGDWVPICVVRRPSGGGNVANTDVYDVRQFLYDPITGDNATGKGDGSFLDVTLRTDSNYNGHSNPIMLRAQASLPGMGVPSYFFSNTQIDPTAATYVEPGTSITANTWYHLYLCPWGSLANNLILPYNAYGSSVQSRGLLVLSSKVPATLPTLASVIRTASADITPPAPWGVAAIPAAACICVGALRRNAGNTGWVPLSIEDGHNAVMEPYVESQVSFGPSAPAVTFSGTYNFITHVPAVARSVRIRLNTQCQPASPSTINGINVAVGGSFVAANFLGTVAWGGNLVFDWSTKLGTSFPYFFQAANVGNITYAGQFQVIGWTL